MISVQPTVMRTAVFSPCRTWRYNLGRIWDVKLPTLTAVMLNPSLANGEKDDRTTVWMMNWARARGYGQYWAVNLFALVGTDPRSLLEHREPIGHRNDEWIRTAVTSADDVIVAWGALSFLPKRSRLRRRPWDVRRLLYDQRLLCFGKTQNHEPRFPRALRSTVEALPYNWAQDTPPAQVLDPDPPSSDIIPCDETTQG